MITGTRTLVLMGSLVVSGAVYAAEQKKEAEANEIANRAACVKALSRPMSIDAALAPHSKAQGMQKAMMNDGGLHYSPPKQPAKGACFAEKSNVEYAAPSPSYASGRKTPQLYLGMCDYPGGPLY